MVKSFLISFLTCLCISSQIYGGISSKPLGKLEKGEYISSSPPFSVKIPGMMTKVTPIHTNQADGKLTEAIFADDMGTLFRLFIASTTLLDFKIASDKQGEFNACVFSNLVLPHLRQVIPEAKVSYEEEVTLENGGPALFVMVDIPKGSLLQDAQSEERFDSMRGFLCFLHGEQHLVFSYQNDISCSPEKHLNAFVTPEYRVNLYKENLLKSANSYHIIPEKAKSDRRFRVTSKNKNLS